MLSVVTGGSGFVGANLVRVLLERGDQVRVVEIQRTETLAGKGPLITPGPVHALRYSPSICHHNASKELAYVARPFVDTIRDTYVWLKEAKPWNNQ